MRGQPNDREALVLLATGLARDTNGGPDDLGLGQQERYPPHPLAPQVEWAHHGVTAPLHPDLAARPLAQSPQNSQQVDDEPDEKRTGRGIDVEHRFPQKRCLLVKQKNPPVSTRE